MAHAHNRTLIQSIGADLDHKTPKHDAACLYLSSKSSELAKRFLINPNQREIDRYVKFQDLKKYWKNDLPDFVYPEGSGGGRCFYCELKLHSDAIVNLTEVQIDIEDIKTHLEVPIIKGKDQYRAHIGFLDVFISGHSVVQEIYQPAKFMVDLQCVNEEHKILNFGSIDYPGNQKRVVYERRKALVIEVKTTRCPIGDLIRQIKLYREYFNDTREYGYSFSSIIWLAAVTYDMTKIEVDALKNEGIESIKIDSKYEKLIVDEKNDEGGSLFEMENI